MHAALGLQQQRNGIHGPLPPGQHLVQQSMNSIPPTGTPRGHAAGAGIVPGTPRNASHLHQMLSASTSSQCKQSHGSAMPEGYLQQQQRHHPFGQQQPPPLVFKANPYEPVFDQAASLGQLGCTTHMTLHAERAFLFVSGDDL